MQEGVKNGESAVASKHSTKMGVKMCKVQVQIQWPSILNSCTKPIPQDNFASKQIKTRQTLQAAHGWHVPVITSHAHAIAQTCDLARAGMDSRHQSFHNQLLYTSAYANTSSCKVDGFSIGTQQYQHLLYAPCSPPCPNAHHLPRLPCCTRYRPVGAP